MSFRKRSRAVLVLMALGLGTSLLAVDVADARRGGSLGSRGARTFQAPAPTATAPKTTQPIQRSMTQPGNPATAAPVAGAARPGGFFGGFGGSMLRGLMLGGLIGLLLGQGFGGIAGLFGFLVQAAIVAFGVMLLMRFLANRRAPAAASAGPSAMRNDMFGGLGGGLAGGLGNPSANPGPAASVPGVGAGSGPRQPKDELGLGGADFDTFERLLGEVQGAFGREDYAALRERTTPEVMSYLAEELGENATRGVRNVVSDVKLLQGDLSEAWRERDADYATVAMRYESRDTMVDRATGALVSGDPDRPTETTELWTFTRRPGGAWKLSAIQEA
ncbi:Tim44 domain-containing protein [Segnochrobactrum spirostomi]|uniref:Tim44 domain-containing protein n=1 Tax=Segnochrobactrum spirostomi TaxID=2608987 RepID=A0A6A7XZK1_9HYPH|nr:Tim44 domain-containing protein [Segnochrobactrum spirostomi]MQT11905.1 Tim44 domain-containing protein [Segnochrobactrum spirostomi]